MQSLVVTIFAAIAVTCFGLLAYPYFIYPVALRLVAKQRLRIGYGAIGPSATSLLFCAFNEVECLPAKLENLRRLKTAHPDLEILAYDDSSSDGTYELLCSAPDLLTVVRGPGRTGKAAGMKIMARVARGDILVFTDANVLLAPDAIEKLLPYYNDPDVGGVCGTLVYSTDPHSVTAQIGSMYWSLDERLRSLESETGNVMGADGSIFSIRRHLYPDFPDTVLDDLTVSMAVIFAGKRLIKAPDVLAFEKGITRRTDELRRKMRIGARAYHTHRHLRPQLREMPLLDRFKYTSRKVLRWFGGLFLSLGTLSALVALAIISRPAALLVAATSGALFLVAARASHGPLARLSELILSILATFIGVWRGIRGQIVTTWAPAKTR